MSLVLRIVVIVSLTFCGLALGAYAAFAAFEYNIAMQPGEKGFWFGCAMVTLTVGCWLLLMAAGMLWRSRKRRAAVGCVSAWFLFMPLVLYNAAGFNAGGRREVVNGKSLAIDAYTRAEKDRELASKGLDAAMAAKRWNEVDKFRTQIDADDKVLAKGKPATSDAQADLLARPGITAKTIGNVLPVLTTVMLELAANIFFWAAGAIPLRKLLEKTVVLNPREQKKRPRRPSQKKPRLAIVPKLNVAGNRTIH
jgi:hypothetical protein